MITAYAPASIGNLAAGFDVLGMALRPDDDSLWGDTVEVLFSTGPSARPQPEAGDEPVGRNTRRTGPDGHGLPAGTRAKSPTGGPPRSDPQPGHEPHDPFTSHAGRHQLVVEGPHGGQVPHDRTNLVVIARDLFARAIAARGGRLPPVRLRLYKNLPLCSGLGSSASSAVAALVGLNRLVGDPLSRHELLHLAGRAEGRVSGGVHLDNVAPALLGGVQLLTPTIDHPDERREPDESRGRRSPQRANAATVEGRSGLRRAPPSRGVSVPAETPMPLPFFSDWRVVVVHPELLVPTRRARAVLPPAVPLKVAVAYWQNLAALVHALHTENRPLAALTLRDLWIERHRRRLVRGFTRVRDAAIAHGAFACSLSGSGPSMFAVVGDANTARRVRGAMVASFGALGIASDGHVCVPDPVGARCL